MSADLLQALIECGTPAKLVAQVATLIDRVDAAERRLTEIERTPASFGRLDVSASEWSKLRQAVFLRDGYRCNYCGAELCSPQCDHVLPLSRGGKSTITNLVTACRPCNASKGGKLLEEWS